MNRQVTRRLRAVALPAVAFAALFLAIGSPAPANHPATDTPQAGQLEPVDSSTPITVDGFRLTHLPASFAYAGEETDQVDLSLSSQPVRPHSGSPTVAASLTAAKFTYQSNAPAGPTSDAMPFLVVTVIRPQVTPILAAKAQFDQFASTHPAATSVSTPVGDGLVGMANERWRTAYITTPDGVILQINGLAISADEVLAVAQGLATA